MAKVVTGLRRTRLFSTALLQGELSDLDIRVDLTSGNGNLLPVTQSPESFREEHQINLKGLDRDSFNDFAPMIEFSDTPFLDPVQRILKRQGFESPTPIQSQSWPIALAKRDIISVARTGSGKTCGFLLPAFHKIMLSQNEMKRDIQSNDRRERRPRRRIPTVLVLAPTRELSMQISDEALKFGRDTRIWTTCLYGGSPKRFQIQTLRNGVDIVVATPGRCNDLLDMGALDVSQIDYLVLDEADRMLDMGFEPQIRQIIDQLPPTKQSLFFTATWPKEVQRLASEFLNQPIQINIGDSQQLNANKAITQHIRMINEREKSKALQELLNEINPDGSTDPSSVSKCIIFVSRKSSCETIAQNLYRMGYQSDSLHGDKSQALRSRTVDRFRSGRIQILVATDVAARGLDIKDIEVIINYDFPVGSSGVEDYVHRIGRTARANKTGVAYTFFTPNDLGRSKELVQLLQRCDQTVPPSLLSAISKPSRGSKGGYSQGRSGGGGRGYGGGSSSGYGGYDRQRSGQGSWSRDRDGGARAGGGGGYREKDSYQSDRSPSSYERSRPQRKENFDRSASFADRDSRPRRDTNPYGASSFKDSRGSSEDRPRRSNIFRR